MPWEITIINGTPEARKPLGSRDDVIAAIAEALPGVLLQQPPGPPPEWLQQMPPAVRDAVLRPKLEADFEAGDFSIQFYTSDEPVVHWVNGEVRGDGNPLPALAAICAKTRWSVIDAAQKSVIDLSSRDGAPEWEQFRRWRDRAIRQIADGERPGEHRS